ncbi:hypothetical protein [Oxalicibacterium faecigallinarum]|uniref:Tail fiber assembly protein n=1 Tax=Oxalicibacterium faecigallinarum TaxID=573741 RepID=A0A8J3F1Q5_9BURK|nr:hypothetical protein [Oxalicibacterium faecigallinarum]GGI16891.1 hypothetical protein GCM10008066_06230 [Oxalicibacterium faecigallinarum]
MEKIVYLFDEATGEFICSYSAPKSPMEEGKYLIPTHSTEVEPPPHIDGSGRFFIDGAWEYKTLPKEETQAEQLTEAQKRRMEIMAELWRIDGESARPARAIALAMAIGEEPNASDIDLLVLLEAQAATLREELGALGE